MFLRKEIKQEEHSEPDNDDECLDYNSVTADENISLGNVPFIDPSIPYDYANFKTEPIVKIEKEDSSSESGGNEDVAGTAEEECAQEQTFDGQWSSSEEVGGGFQESDDEPLVRLVKKKKEAPKPKPTKEKVVPSRGEFWR